MKKLLSCLLLILFSAIACASDRDDDHGDDQDKARAAVERGEVASYSDMESAISRQLKGRIIRVELDKDWFIWYYKLRLLEDDGRIIKVKLNARTLQLLKLEGKALENVIKHL